MKYAFLVFPALVCWTTTMLTGTVLASSYTYTATVDGVSTWNRPVENGPAAPVDLSLTALNAGYHSKAIIVDTDGDYTFDSTYTGSSWDNYTFLYLGSFDPLSPLASVLIGNDDGLGGVGTSGFIYSLVAGNTYFFVTTGFSDSDLGTALNSVSGPGSIGTTPEPGTLFATLAGLGLLGIGKKLKAA